MPGKSALSLNPDLESGRLRMPPKSEEQYANFVQFVMAVIDGCEYVHRLASAPDHHVRTRLMVTLHMHIQTATEIILVHGATLSAHVLYWQLYHHTVELKNLHEVLSLSTISDPVKQTLLTETAATALQIENMYRLLIGLNQK